jgi:protein-tyrosine phosphatase
MIDIHCHILPGVDDGADSWEVALEMCRIAAADGITQIVATPHANNEYTYDRERLKSTAQQLMERTAGVPNIVLGCDFHFSYENVQDALSNPSRYTIGETPYLLVELSDFSVPPNFMDALHRLVQTGLRPILTHPERNPLLQHRPEQVLEWAGKGLIVQLTANALTGDWGKTAQRTARWLLEHNGVHVVATDAHDVRHRPPLLSPARRVLCNWQGEEVARALLEDNPAAVACGGDLLYFPVPSTETEG